MYTFYGLNRICVVEYDLLVILIGSGTTRGLGGGVALRATLNTTSTGTTVGGGEGKVDELLGVESDDKGRNINELLTNTDVTLTDQDTGVMDGLGKAELEDLSLKATLQEILNLKGKDIIELVHGLVEDTNTDQTTDQGITLERTTGILLVQGQELTGSLTDASQGIGNTVDFTLVTETKLTAELHLMVKTSLIVGTTGSLGSLRV